VGEALERLANLRLLENIDMLELGAHGAQRGHRLRGKPALRKVRRTLHEQHHGARAELGLDPFHDIHLHFTSSVCAARQAPPADAIAQPRSWTASVRSPRPCADSRRTSPAHRAGKLRQQTPSLSPAHGRPASDLLARAQTADAPAPRIERADVDARRWRAFLGLRGFQCVELWGCLAYSSNAPGFLSPSINNNLEIYAMNPLNNHR